MEKVVAVGDAAPGGGTFSSFDCPACLQGVNQFGPNDNGQVAFLATLSTGDKGIFVASAESGGFTVEKVAVTGDANPAGGVFTGFSPPTLNNAGQVAFMGTGSEQAVFIASPQVGGFSITKLAATGDPTPIGGTFAGFWPTQQVPSINDNGDIALVAVVLGGASESAIFLATPDSGGFTIGKVIAVGDASPVGPFVGFSPATALNNSRQVAFAGCVSTCNTPDNGLFVASPSAGSFSVSKVVMQGDPSPTGSPITDFNLPSLNETGQVAFMGCEPGCSYSTKGIFLASPTQTDFSIAKLVSSGDAAPSGGTFSQIENTPALNDSQRVAFIALISDGPVTHGMFLTSPESAVEQLVVPGDPSPIGGVFEGISASPPVNALGRVVFYAVVTGGSATSGIFLTSPVPVSRTWGDVDCHSQVNAVDALKLLRYSAGLSAAQSDQCPVIGTTVTVGGTPHTWGDVDCSGGVDSVDALKLLRFVAGLPSNQAQGCPAMGATVNIG